MLESLFGKSKLPEQKVEGYSPEANAVMDAQLAQGGESLADVENKSLAGMDDAANQLRKSPEEYQTQNQALGLLSNDGMQKALQERANRNFESTNIAQKNKVKYGAADTLARQYQGAGQAANMKMQAQKTAYNARIANLTAQKNARNSAISSIFKIGGMVGGAVLGSFVAPGVGTAAGAQAGAAIGGGLGPKEQDAQAVQAK